MAAGPLLDTRPRSTPNESPREGSQSATASTVQRALLLAALMGGFALRWFHLGGDSLWYDEAVSVSLAQRPVGELIARTAGDIHPPAYYLLLHVWREWFRPDVAHGLEALYALPSVAASLMILALLYAIGRRTLGPRAALYAVWFAALSPFQLWYAQEVRMYTLAGALGLVCFWATLKWMLDRKALWLALFAVTAAAGMYTLYYFLFVLAGLTVAAALLAPSVKRFVAWLLAALGALALFAPWLPIAWRQVTDPPVPSWRVAWGDFSQAAQAAFEALAAHVTGQTPVLGPLWLWAVVATILTVVFAVYVRRGRRVCGAILAAVFTGPALIFLISLAATPLYHVRYLFATSCGFALVAAGAFDALDLRRRRLGQALFAALAAANLLALRVWWTSPQYRADDHRRAVAELAEQWRPGDVILANAGWILPVFDVYWPREGPAVAPPLRIDAVARGAELPAISLDDPRAPIVRTGSVGGASSLGWGDPASDFFAVSQVETVEGLERLANHYRRVWHYRLYDTVSDADGAIRAWLDSNTRLLRDEAVPGRDYARLELREFDSSTQSAQGEGQSSERGEYDDAVRNVGVQAAQRVRAGHTLYVDSAWEALPGLAEIPVGLSASLRLYDAAGLPMAQADGPPPWPTTEWPAGERVRWPMALPVPATLAPGSYTLELIVYRQDDGAPLAARGPNLVDGQRLNLATVEVEPH